MQDLSVSLLQVELIWEDKKQNLSHLADFISRCPASDLIVLPEMFSTGFTMSSEAQAEGMDGEAVSWLIAQAKQKNAAICGSLIIEEKGKYYNRFCFVYPDGKLEHYDKRHLFRMANEHEHYSAGKEHKTVELKGWHIDLQVCYDLRFPVWTRNRSNFDLQLFVANWPEARVNAWSTLLRARAIENLCYVAGVNRIGLDGNGVQYSGGTAAIDPKGNTLAEATDHKEEIVTVRFSASELKQYREKFPAYLDADVFELKK